MTSPTHQRINRLKRLLFGEPKRTEHAHHERLGVAAALAVFSADGLSSVAYATEEIMYVLVTAGTAASVYSLPIGLAIVLLVLIVAASYSQTIHAYPTGGGSYIVSKENLGAMPGLIAGGALLVDYVLTVAVSASAGIDALTSALPALRGHEIGLNLLAIWFIAWVNLRGLKESGAVFSLPTYGFIVSIFVLVGAGIFKVLIGDWHPAVPWQAGFGMAGPGFSQATKGVTLFLLLRAFSSGCTALTGLEAVSNGVQAFKPPEDKNAIRTMNWERTILYLMFAGITILAYGFSVLPSENETVLSQIAREVFGGKNVLYWFVQGTTALILLLAANTAYADFPRLLGLIAKDGYMPRKLANRSDTLVFHWGIYILASMASVLTVIFRGSTHLLIPLYAVGVFTAFTLSQSGMVVHWVREAARRNEPVARHWWSIFINGLGAVLTGIVMVIIAITKFAHGAWVVLIVLPLMITYFLHVHQYYARFRVRVEDLKREQMPIDTAERVKVVLTIGGLSPVIDHSLRVARRISDDITAVYVAVEPELGEKVQRKWDVTRHRGVNLKVLESPYRDVIQPLKKYLNELVAHTPETVINLLVPVIVTNEPFDDYLHNGVADQIIRELRYSQGILVTEIPFYVNMEARAESAIVHDPANA